MKTSIPLLQQITPPLRWYPTSGACTEEFLRRKSKDPNGPSYDDLTSPSDSVLVEAQRILGRCLPPTANGPSETGLVVGYVQSGKTMSFETVIALARDNGFGLVIVLAGTQNILRDQSEDRLKRDLGIDDGDEHWHHLSNPTILKQTEAKNKLDAWKKKGKKSLLITVLKNRTRIDGLQELLCRLAVADVPALIIDDESDQASLNTNAARIKRGKIPAQQVSETYRAIGDLRDTLPRHSYLQYTATPQANLLLAQADFLNPNFAELVTPGAAYTGGKAFFGGNSRLLCDIPAKEVPTPTNILRSPPKSLLMALRFFLLAAAQHSMLRVSDSDKKRDRNRAMMVHPSQATASHKTYKKWVDKALKSLRTTVEGMWGADATNPNPSFVRAHFQAEYDSLTRTDPNIYTLDQLLDKMVDDVFDELNAVEVNGTPDAEKKIDWKANRYWILVGGMKLDRGYTVEGLCITYMPRPLGGAPAADTLQQRARFFGYKKKYLGTCRVFLQPTVRRAFTEYVEHEEFVRSALMAHRGKPLSHWRRDFILTELLRPTRPNVVGLGVRRVPVDGWLVPDVLQRDDASASINRALLKNVRKQWESKYGAPVSASSRVPKALKSTHTVFVGLPLRVVLEDFLLEVQVKDPQDSEQHAAMLIALGVLVANDPAALADVFLMNDLQPGYRTRGAGRGLSASERFAPINQYWSQSAGTVNDRDFRAGDRVSLQLRSFDLGTHQREPSRADIKNVTWFAVNVPKAMMKALIVENR